MADLTPIRITGADTAPSVPSTIVLPVDSEDFAKGYKLSIDKVAGFGRITAEVAWAFADSSGNINWYGSNIPLSIDTSSILAMYSSVFDDNGFVYEPHSIYDESQQGQEYKPGSNPENDNWRRYGFEVCVRYNKLIGALQFMHNYASLSNSWGMIDNPSGWGHRPSASTRDTTALRNFRRTDIVRVRTVILYDVAKNE